MSRCKLRTEQIERIGSVLSSITSFGDTEIKIRPIRQITLPGGFVDVLVSFAFGASTRCEYGCAEHLMWEELGLGFDLRVLEQLPQQLPRSTHRTWQPWRRVAVHRPLHFCYGLFAMVCAGCIQVLLASSGTFCPLLQPARSRREGKGTKSWSFEVRFKWLAEDHFQSG